jgi:O-acetyl-ADP-ribose deacetylase (regulator of RNase III)
MLLYHRTSLLESTAQTVVNTVNCVGVMGKGLAAEFKKKFPDMFKTYKSICESGLLEPGKLWLRKADEQWILNFPTKLHWRNPSKLEWIESGLHKFTQEYDQRGITDIAFPRLGCGNGGLDWEEVRPMMEHYLSKLPIRVYIHDFVQSAGLPEHLEPYPEAAAQSQHLADDFESFEQYLL